jgi:D-3-phosphoglycerate dehydrogenase / 2-oxoglutarate reductase
MRRMGVQKARLADLLGRCDVVSVHARFTPETRGLMGRETFSQMKHGTIFINNARREIVDESAPAMPGARHNSLGRISAF